MSNITNTITENITLLESDIKKACKYAGVDDAHPKIIAVSKRQDPNRITEALNAGLRIFGENQVQEASQRWPELRSQYDGIELHLIGGLQSNKTAEAVALFDVIESVDREKIARSIARECQKQDRHPDIYIQVNTGEEPQKGGVLPTDLDSLVQCVRDELSLPLVGLMAIPPTDDDPAMHFALLKKLSKRHNLERLSMGMSSDFALAASMGATDIRVGTAIFGDRKY